MNVLVWALAAAGTVYAATSPGTADHMQACSFKCTTAVELSCRYWLALPAGYENDPARRWPLLLFLHGAGERGDDLELVKKHGPPRRIAEGRTYPFIVAAPQCPAGAWWEDVRQVQTLAALLDELERALRVDPDRVYLTGLSMGGYGTWRLAAEYPDRFAAIVPICGGGRWFMADRIRHLPAWVVHGAKDTVVPPQESQLMVEALRRAGGAVEFRLDPEAGHDSWTAAYDEPQLYEWLLRQVRRPRTPAVDSRR